MGELAGIETPRTRLVTAPFLLQMGSTFLGVLAMAALLPVLPRYADGPLAVGAVGVGVAVGAASVTSVLAQPWAGGLADRHGRRLLALVGPLLLAAATLGYLAADSLAVLLALRLVAGVGEGFLFVAGATTIADLAPADRRGQAMSYFTLAPYGGLALGPLLGELVFGGDRYGTVWLASAAIAGVAALLALAVPETRPEREGDAPRGRLVHRAALAPGLVLLCALIGFGGFIAFAALYALELGLDGGGVVFLEFAAIVVAVRLFGARIPDVLGPTRCARIAIVLLASGFALMGAWQEPAALFVGTALMAVGQSFAYPALVTYAVGRAPAWERSSVIGTFSAFVDVAIVAGAAAFGVAVALAGYGGAFLAVSATALLGLVFLFRLERPATA